MERYEAYKDSGVEWIGEIPEEWSIARSGHVIRLHSGESLDSLLLDDENPIPVYGGGGIKGYYLKSNIGAGSVIVSRQGATCGTTRYITAEAWATEHALVVCPQQPIDMRWVTYWLETERLGQYSMTSAQPGISAQLVESLPILVLNIKTQRAIADYLDAKTAEIDALVADCEREVELLQEYRKAVITEAVTKGLDPDAPMKDSGIEWIGEVPASWETNKLRYCGTTQNGISKGGEYFGSGYPFISYGNAYRNELDKPELFGLIESSADERERYGIRRGDVLFTRTSETIEEVGIAAVALCDIADCCFAGFLIRFRPNSSWGVLPEYAAYYFRSDLYRPYLTKEMVLVTRASMSQQLLGGITILIPPASEQEDIAAYLDAKTAEIDSLIEAKQSMADKLREYRRALISEAVTGKFKVPGA